MKFQRVLIAAALAAVISAPAFADDTNTTAPSTDTSVERNFDQQQRNLHGLKSDQLTT
jgi:hypothetical protein